MTLNLQREVKSLPSGGKCEKKKKKIVALCTPGEKRGKINKKKIKILTLNMG